MNASNLRVCLIVILLTLQATHGFEEDVFDKESTLSFYIWKLAESVNEFGFNLHYRFSDNFVKNLVFSPLSVANTLAMIHFGARGRTARELAQVLGYEQSNLTRSAAARAYKYFLTEQIISVKPKHYQFDMANAIFIKSNLKLIPAYKKRVEDFYRAPIKYVDFSENATDAITEINEMVREKTRNKIKKIIDDLDPATDIVSVNVAYFKGLWKTMFRANQIRDGIFYNKGYIEKAVTYMEMDSNLYHAMNFEATIFELPFKGNNASMFIILPARRDGLIDLERIMTHRVFFEYLGDLKTKRVQVKIPKFKFSYSGDLSTTLQKLGIIQLFQPTTVNLAGMVRDENVAMGEVKHKAIIEINESGVEAAAVTITTPTRSGPLKLDAIVNVEHPFMFFLFDRRSGMILFMGRVWEL